DLQIRSGLYTICSGCFPEGEVKIAGSPAIAAVARSNGAAATGNAAQREALVPISVGSRRPRARLEGLAADAWLARAIHRSQSRILRKNGMRLEGLAADAWLSTSAEPGAGAEATALPHGVPLMGSMRLADSSNVGALELHCARAASASRIRNAA